MRTQEVHTFLVLPKKNVVFVVLFSPVFPFYGRFYFPSQVPRNYFIHFFTNMESPLF